MYLLEGRLLRQLTEIAVSRAPHEAVGLILDEFTVVELNNLSPTPEDHFMVSREDIQTALGTPRAEHLDSVVLWHSHPSGGVGPSRTDLQHKTPFKYHLVLALVDQDLVPTWY